MDFDKILEKIYHFYPPNPVLYKDFSFYKSKAVDKLYSAWDSQDEEKTWLPFIDKLNKNTGLRLVTIYRGAEFCFKAYGEFTEFAEGNINTTLVVSVSTMITFHSIYVSQQEDKKIPVRTFFDPVGNSVDYFEPCYSDECKQIIEMRKRSLYQEGFFEISQKSSLKPGAIKIIKNISDITSQFFNTNILPLDFINKQIDKIAVENSFVGDVNLYMAAFTPHVI